MFTAALFTTARTRKQPRCPSTDQWIKKMWYIYTTKYYSAINRIAIKSFEVIWKKLVAVIQSEESEREQQILYINTHIYNLDSRKMILMNLFARRE